jgi:hypothetical protein
MYSTHSAKAWLHTFLTCATNFLPLFLLPQETSYRHPQDRWLTGVAGKRKTFPLGQNLEFLGRPMHSVVATPAEVSIVPYELITFKTKDKICKCSITVVCTTHGDVRSASQQTVRQYRPMARPFGPGTKYSRDKTL